MKIDLKSLTREQLIEIINNKNKQLEANDKRIKSYEYSIKKYKDNETKYQAKIRKLTRDLEKLRLKYENEVELVKKANAEKYIGKSEKQETNIVNEVERNIDKRTKERKTKTSPKEQFIKEIDKLMLDVKEVIEDYDFKENDIDRNSVKPFGEDTSYKIEAKSIPINIFKVIRPKYKDKNNIYQKLSNDVFPHSVLTPSFAANIITFKYELAVPLYRYSKYIEAQTGLVISEGDLSNYVKRAAEKLTPLYEELRKELKINNKVCHIDETTLNVIDVKEKQNCYIFVYRTSHWTQNQIAIYEFNTSRKTDKVGSYLENFKGYVVTDGYAGYDFLKSKGIKVQRCWVHIRRYFFDCIKVLPKEKRKASPVFKIIELIGNLFHEESKMLDDEFTPDEIKRRRNSIEYLNILDKIDEEVNNLNSQNIKSDLIKKALNYYLKIREKGELRTFLEDGQIEIDNNLAEITVKPFVIGRKNFLFSKTISGATISGILYSIVQTSILNGLNSERYIDYVLSNIDNCKDISKLLPWNDDIQNKFTVIKKEN